MIDHLLTFVDEAAAQAALSAYWNPASDDGPGNWNGSVCIPGVSVYAVTGTETHVDPDTQEEYQVDVRQYYPGWHIWVTLDCLDDTLTSLPECRIAADYEAWAAVADGWTWDGDRSWITYMAQDLPIEVIQAAHIEPSFGREWPYPFGIEV